ncbi:MAG: LPS export ABC transporter ATP-binding protein [Magnetococcales bacterium]|nr:LPS export ABC transporter ATP-binding protein [Magnetococcales bacterium]
MNPNADPRKSALAAAGEVASASPAPLSVASSKVGSGTSAPRPPRAAAPRRGKNPAAPPAKAPTPVEFPPTSATRVEATPVPAPAANLAEGLRATGLSKTYKGRRVVTEVSLSLTPGEVVGLLGPNGAGKTTTFYMIVGLIPADQGSIRLDGREITREPMHRRARAGISYLPQEPSVFRKMTVLDNVLAILETLPMTREDREERAEELLGDLGVSHLEGTMGFALSGGERRRVEVARALAINPRYILLDEPFAGVDPLAVEEIQSIIRLLRERGVGVLITDHNVRETLKICDRACILFDGAVLAEGNPETLIQAEQVRKLYLGERFRM